MNLRPFELALAILFGVFILAALLILQGYQPKPDEEDKQLLAIGQVSIWGTVPAEGINSVLTELRATSDAYGQVSYRYLSPETFDDTLLRALADRQGPDVVLMSHEKLVAMRSRIQPFSYDTFPIRDFQNQYIDGAQIFLLADGVYGYPIAVDPLMMYWNKDILATEGYLHPPATWEMMINTMFPSLIKRSFDRSIERSVVAMGEYHNVRNSFGILSTLFIQGGSERVVENDRGQYVIRLRNSPSGQDPLRAAADFYTRFSRPSNTLYSWNRAFVEDRQQFIAGDLVFYFGYGSEAGQIQRLNPNLHFDIAEVPQGETASARRTYGKFYALSLMKNSNNQNGAMILMQNLAGSETSEKIALASNFVPVRRHLVSAGSDDTFGRVTYYSAGVALGWLNPELEKSNELFQTMTNDINENRRDVSSAITDVVRRLENEY